MSDQLTPNFKLSEFKCRDGTEVPEEFRSNVEVLAENLQVLREYIQKPIVVISGYRSPKYNRKIGGARRSQHLKASAADIIVPGMHPDDVRSTIIKLIKEGKMAKGGVGRYTTFTHYDIRGWNARWSGSGIKDSRS